MGGLKMGGPLVGQRRGILFLTNAFVYILAAKPIRTRRFLLIPV